ncbi:60S ribosomal export protein NMD3 [Candidatus Micrarchaeota archaeon]|nr:60S ribosomal export protein NMD3 [Candidatus Micrarchaeota archaeon]MBU1165880.1 60S ribosomal export protein NMD3 [Candidatus Micrarchaeota archaeon]MBU1886998.1 60S ribosomal export protein NMD3 [Candidatus Micrarchaeota archaeon]
MIELICPKCGKTNKQMDFIEAFCINCYPIKIETPAKIETERCRECGKIKLRGEWVTYTDKKFAKYIISKCKGTFSTAEYDNAKNTITFTIDKQTETTIKRDIILDVKTNMCGHCSRISGGYFQGIVQLRGDEKRIKKHADQLIEQLAKKTFLTKTEEKDGGFDIYVGNSKAVVELFSKLKIKVRITKKLVGAEQGKRLYRTTFLIRL